MGPGRGLSGNCRCWYEMVTLCQVYFWKLQNKKEDDGRRAAAERTSTITNEGIFTNFTHYSEDVLTQTSAMLSHAVNETDPWAQYGWDTARISPGWRSVFVSFAGVFSEPGTYSSVFLGCGLRGLCGRKEVGHRCGLRFSSVHASPASSCGPAEMWTGLARTKCFHLPQGHLHSPLAGGGRLTCQDTGPGLWASGRGHALRAQVQKTSRYNSLQEGRQPGPLCRIPLQPHS